MSEKEIKEESPEVKEDAEEDVVDPWNVSSKSDTGIDYDKLVSKFITKFKAQ